MMRMFSKAMSSRPIQRLIKRRSFFVSPLMKRSFKVKLADKPIVLMFGPKDPALASKSVIAHWRKQFPDATYIDLPEAGHYIQEDAPDEIIEAIRAAFG